MDDFSDFIIFADESGDHGMENIDTEFPVFALVFCVFSKNDYSRNVEPGVRELKFKYFGHDVAILHEREVRKQLPPFGFLRRRPDLREKFYDDLNNLISSIPMQVIVSVIDKNKHRDRYANPWNPYQVAMHFCMEKLCDRMITEGQRGKLMHVLFEGRGKVEDASLELEFRKITQNNAHWGYRKVDFTRCGFEPIFVPKAANHAGHQISDLIARPLALRALRPEQPNRASDVVWGKVQDWKVFP